MMNPIRDMGPFPLGVRYDQEKKELFASFETIENGECGICLYDQKGRRKIPFSPEDRLGKVHFGRVKLEKTALAYTFFENDREFTDPYGRLFVKKGRFGEASLEGRKALLTEQDFDWEGDRLPRIPYEDAICYGLHVRGFTMHSSSQVKEKGTFLGLSRKIPYLKDLGVTTLVLQPAYEFEESICLPSGAEGIRPTSEDGCIRKTDYWGYERACYYAPKASFAYGKDAAFEFAQLVKELHKNQMELMMQFYFPDDFDRNEILPILHFWSYCYHVDGFQLMGKDLPTERIGSDSALCERKIWYYHFDTERIYGKKEVPYRNLAAYSDEYMYVMRRFLKGEDGCILPFSQMIRRNDPKMGMINFIADYQGFTLHDLFTYDRKHNEANGEDNRDGSDYNFSWNCGVEGESRKKQVMLLRSRLRECAVILLMLSQGTPYLYMGDEFGRTQKGNNNPYCQDNATTWLNWKLLEKNREFAAFVKKWIAFRKEHAIFRQEQLLKMMDTENCGYPDLSFHGESPWKPEFYHHQHHIGMMYNGKYAGEDVFWYIAVNLHWEKHTFSLPKLGKGRGWKSYDTKEPEAVEQAVLEPRTIRIFIGE